MEGNSTINFSEKHHLIHPTSKRNGKDNKNNLLFGIADGNIYKFNGKTFEKQFLEIRTHNKRFERKQG